MTLFTSTAGAAHQVSHARAAAGEEQGGPRPSRCLPPCPSALARWLVVTTHTHTLYMYIYK